MTEEALIAARAGRAHSGGLDPGSSVRGRHVPSLQASDDEVAVVNARDGLHIDLSECNDRAETLGGNNNSLGLRSAPTGDLRMPAGKLSRGAPNQTRSATTRWRRSPGSRRNWLEDLGAASINQAERRRSGLSRAHYLGRLALIDHCRQREIFECARHQIA